MPGQVARGADAGRDLGLPHKHHFARRQALDHHAAARIDRQSLAGIEDKVVSFAIV